MTGRAFTKMHGLGNDFVVIDARADACPLSRDQARRIADRRLGVGCDQLIVLEPPSNGAADVFMRIRNPDGGEAQACGNATRCIADALMAEQDRSQLTVETVAGLLQAERAANGLISVDMGPAYLQWDEIPLAGPCDTLSLDLSLESLSAPTAVGMGNPHAVFFVEDAEAIDLGRLGPQLERDDLFPESANISIAQVTGPDRLRLRVWERGAGITLACGSAACATTVAAHRRGLTGRRCEVRLDGGTLTIQWREDGHVLMTGPVATSFTGRLDPRLYSGEA